MRGHALAVAAALALCCGIGIAADKNNNKKKTTGSAAPKAAASKPAPQAPAKEPAVQTKAYARTGAQPARKSRFTTDAFRSLDRNSDGYVTRAEWMHNKEWSLDGAGFDRLDDNPRDGRLSRSEWRDK